MPVAVAVSLAVRLSQTTAAYEYERDRLLTRLAGAGRAEVLKEIHRVRPGVATLRALVQVGDCEAERELLEDEASAPLPSGPWADRHDHWLNHVRCRESVPSIVERIVQAEARDADHSYLSSLHAALRRAAGLDGLRIYDELMDD